MYILLLKNLKRESCGSKGSEQPPTSWGAGLKSCGHHLLVPWHTPRVAVAAPLRVAQARGVVADELGLDAAGLFVVLGPRLFAARLGHVHRQQLAASAHVAGLAGSASLTNTQVPPPTHTYTLSLPFSRARSPSRAPSLARTHFRALARTLSRARARALSLCVFLSLVHTHTHTLSLSLDLSLSLKQVSHRHTFTHAHANVHAIARAVLILGLS